MNNLRILLLTALSVCLLAWCTAGAAETLTLPVNVTAIEEEAFSGDASLNQVVLPEGLLTIGSKAFADSSVTAVNLPDSLTSIADDAFDGTAITTLTVNEGTYAWEWAVSHGYFGWEYEEQTDGTVVITGFTHTLGTVSIPRQIGEKRVSALADGAFAGTLGLVNVTVPGTVDRIGAGAFAAIGSLQTVMVEQGVKIIGSEAFTDCPRLTSVTLPESGVTLGGSLFKYCQALKTATLPAGIPEVPYHCFWDCQKLESIVIQEGVTAISDGAFYNCFALRTATVPDSLVSIGKNAFHACSRLENITLSAGTTEIHETAFSDCEYLVMHAPEGCVAAQYAIDHDLVPETVVLESAHPYFDSETHQYQGPEGAAGLLVTFSGKTCINGMYNLDLIVITDGKGDEMTYSGDSLAGVTLMVPGDHFSISLQSIIPLGADFGFRITSVEALDQNAYDAYVAELEAHPWVTRVVNGTLEIIGYRGLATELTVPVHINGAPVASIGEKAFQNNGRLTRVTIEEGIISIGAYAFAYCPRLETVTIPASVTAIGEYAFRESTSLTAIAIPDGISELSAGTFIYCSSLTDVTLPGSLTAIGDSAFAYCESLTAISLPEGLTTLGKDTFNSTGLTSVSLPDGITRIPFCCFMECTHLESVHLPASLTELGDSSFANCYALASVTLPEGLQVLGSNAFTSCPITQITLPESLTTIGQNAFSGCPLTSMYIPAAVTSLASNAFYLDASLTEILVSEDNPNYSSWGSLVLDKAGTTLILAAPGIQGEVTVPGHITQISNSAFTGCNKLTRVVIPAQVESLGDYIFMDCEALTEVVILAPITVLPEFAVGNCPSLTSITLPDTLTEIGQNAFSKCGLTSLTLPAGVRSIGYGAMMSCPNLETVVFPEGLERIDMVLGRCPMLKRVYIPASVTFIDDENLYVNCGDAAVVTPRDSYAWNWATGWGIPVQEPD